MWMMIQQRLETTLDQFATRLRQLSSSCEFASVDKEIKSQIIVSCFSSRLRRRALREPTITLKALLDLGRTMELSETQVSGIESQSSTLFDEDMKLTTLERLSVHQLESRYLVHQHVDIVAYPRPQGQLSCPARGAEPRACGKLNHFARVCRFKPISTSSSDRRPPPGRSLFRETPPTNPLNSRSQSSDSDNNSNTLSNQQGSASGKCLQVHCLTVLLQTER